MAEAVKELYPETQVTIGPAIENGFYYDFSRSKPFTTEDLEKIENKMREISKRSEEILREEWDRDEAIKFFNKIGEKYKAEIISTIPKNEKISLYRQGQFIDLCRGPHAPSTSHVKYFKLMKVAGAYWRGDEKNPMLTRVYGIAFDTAEELEAYEKQIEEAKARDHRKLGKELDLFTISPLVGAGLPLLKPKGMMIRQQIENYLWDLHKDK